MLWRLDYMRRWNLAGQRRPQTWERGAARRRSFSPRAAEAKCLMGNDLLVSWAERSLVGFTPCWGWNSPLARQKCVVLCQFYVATSIHIFHHCSTMFIIIKLISIYFILYLHCLPFSYFIYPSIFIHTVYTAHRLLCISSVFIPLTVYSSFNSFYILFCRLCTLLFTLLLFALLVRS